VRKRSFHPTLKTGAPPCALTLLSHCAAEGLGVRAKNANASHAVNLRNHAGSYSFFLNSGFSSLSDLM